MQLEKMLLEYDCFPILAIYVEDGKRYFCNGTELRTYTDNLIGISKAAELLNTNTSYATELCEGK